jgi:iron complex transport system substrate-binding protein
MVRPKTLIAVVILAAFASSCGGASGSATTSTLVRPQTSAAQQDNEPARVFVGADGVASGTGDTSRIVTLSGDLTEAVFELGLGESIVARDVTTIYPPQALDLPIVGVGRFLSAEGVLRENPTLVLGDTQTSPPEAIDQIRNAGVPVVIFDVPTELDALYAKAVAIGEALGVPEAGTRLAATMEAAVTDEVSSASPIDPAPGVAFVYSRGPDVMLLFGAGMTTQPMIEAAGGRDVGAASGVEGTVSVTPEAIVAAAPDVIVTTTEGLEALGGIDGLLAIPGFAETPAGQERRILDYPEGDFLTFGPRIGEILGDFIADLRAAFDQS